MDKQYTPYQNRIRECSAQAYKFLDTHKHPRTDADWQNIAETAATIIEQANDPLLTGLMLAVLDELEREYKTKGE